MNEADSRPAKPPSARPFHGSLNVAGNRARFRPRRGFVSRQVLLLAVLLVAAALVAIAGLSGPGRGVALRTLVLGVGAAGLAVPLGWMVWRAGTGDFWLARGIVGLTLVAAMLPPWAQVCGWDAAFGKLGWLTSLVTGRFTPLVPPFLAAIWIHATIAAPQAALVLHWFQAGDGWELEEQASLAVPPRRVFFDVTLPRMLPALAAGAAWTMLSASREIAVTDLYQIGTLAELVYLGYAQGANDTLSGLWPGGKIALGWPLYVFVMGGLLAIAAGLAVTIQRRLAARTPVHRRTWIELERRPWLAAAGTLVLLVIPLANLFVRCGLRTIPGDDGPQQVWGLGHVLKSFALATGESLPEWRWSLAIAMFGATALLIGTCVVSAIVRRGGWLAGLALLTVVIAGALPGPVVGRLLTGVGNQATGPVTVWLWDRTILGPVLASTIYCWPVAMVVGWGLVRAVPTSLYEQAALDGCGPWQRFWMLTVGLNAAGWGGLWAILFALVFGELSASHLVRPSGIDILPRLALGKMHSGIDEVTAAIGLSATTAVAGLALAGGWMFRNWSKLNSRGAE